MQRRAHTPRINTPSLRQQNSASMSAFAFLCSEAGDSLTQTAVSQREKTAQGLVNPLTLSYMCLADTKLSFQCSVRATSHRPLHERRTCVPTWVFLALCWTRVDIMTGRNECSEAAKGLDENASSMRKCKSDAAYSGLSLDGALSLLAVLLQVKH